MGKNRKKSVVLVVCVALFSLLCGEVCLRIGIYFEIPFFRNPALYTDFFSEDAYWKLAAQWRPERYPLPSVDCVDPALGWNWHRSGGAENPLGILRERPYTAVYTGPIVLFYGDSFTEGAGVSMVDTIPAILERGIPPYTVYNYGVGGYGLDQIYVRYKRTHAQFEKPIVSLGLLTTDIDRVVLSFRTGQKPRFVFIDGRLSLDEVPIVADQRSWLEANPVFIKSYLYAGVMKCLRMLKARGNMLEVAYRRDEKKAIARAILAEMVAQVEKNEQPFVVTLFYVEEELDYLGWRESFLRQLFDELTIPYVDTKRILLEDAARNTKAISDYYYQDPHPAAGHLKPVANHLVAEEIAEYLRREKIVS